MSLPAQPKLPSKPRLPGGVYLPLRPLGNPTPVEEERDQFGLATAVYGKAPLLSRQYISRALDYLKLPKTVSPTVLFGPGQGTIPELVVFGWFLAHNYAYQFHGPRGFFFQSFELGGRQLPGGAVVDFEAFVSRGRRIGVDVDSVYHSTKNPFAPSGKMESDRLRRVKLIASTRLDNVISVNEQSWGFPLEHGSSALVANDLERIEYA